MATKVRATRMGYYGNQRRRVGEEFDLADKDKVSPGWMEVIAAPTPAPAPAPVAPPVAPPADSQPSAPAAPAVVENPAPEAPATGSQDVI